MKSFIVHIFRSMQGLLTRRRTYIDPSLQKFEEFVYTSHPMCQSHDKNNLQQDIRRIQVHFKKSLHQYKKEVI